MSKDIKEYLPYYIGQECIVSASEFYEAGRGKLVRIDIEDMENLVVVSSNTLHDRTQYCVEADMKDVKLLLRSLSDMTEEELDKCGNIDYDFRDDPDLSKQKWEYFESVLSPLQFHYLLKQGFDLFGLIHDGLAIEKTLTNNQQQ